MIMQDATFVKFVPRRFDVLQTRDTIVEAALNSVTEAELDLSTRDIATKTAMIYALDSFQTNRRNTLLNALETISSHHLSFIHVLMSELHFLLRFFPPNSYPNN
jgi:hypothetical protein